MAGRKRGPQLTREQLDKAIPLREQKKMGLEAIAVEIGATYHQVRVALSPGKMAGYSATRRISPAEKLRRARERTAKRRQIEPLAVRPDLPDEHVPLARALLDAGFKPRPVATLFGVTRFILLSRVNGQRPWARSSNKPKRRHRDLIVSPRLAAQISAAYAVNPDMIQDF